MFNPNQLLKIRSKIEHSFIDTGRYPVVTYSNVEKVEVCEVTADTITVQPVDNEDETCVTTYNRTSAPSNLPTAVKIWAEN